MAKKQDKITEKKKSGRKRKIESPEEMRERAYQYFIECEQKDKSPNYAGLALYLGLSSKTQINEYYNNFPEFKETIDELKSYIESIYLDKLESKDYATAGIIFNLKCNFGYNDKQEDKSDKITDTAMTIKTIYDLFKKEKENKDNEDITK